jgi:hypothetical protein
VVRVESLQVVDENARGRIIWSSESSRKAHDLTLRRVGGKWRVTDDRPARGHDL